MSRVEIQAEVAPATKAREKSRLFITSISLRESMPVTRDKADMRTTLDGNYPLNTSVLHQGPESAYHKTLKMFARQMDIDSFLIAINLPQRKYIRLFTAPADLVLNHALLSLRCSAQLSEERLRDDRILADFPAFGSGRRCIVCEDEVVILCRAMAGEAGLMQLLVAWFPVREVSEAPATRCGVLL